MSAAAELVDTNMAEQRLTKDVRAEEKQKDPVVGVVFRWISDPDCVQT